MTVREEKIGDSHPKDLKYNKLFLNEEKYKTGRKLQIAQKKTMESASHGMINSKNNKNYKAKTLQHSKDAKCKKVWQEKSYINGNELRKQKMEKKKQEMNIFKTQQKRSINKIKDEIFE